MCTHIRRDFLCGHHRFFVHIFCKEYYATHHDCRLYVIHREFWSNRICSKECSEYGKFVITSPVAQRRLSPPRSRFSPHRQSSPRARHQQLMSSTSLASRGIRGPKSHRSPLSRELRLDDLVAAATTQEQQQAQQ